MNIIERQTKLGKSLVEINTTSLKSTAMLQRDNIAKYFETNRDFGSRLPEIKDLATLVSLQREYSETLWNNTKEAVQAQSEIVKTAFSSTREAFTSVYSADDSNEAITDADAPVVTDVVAETKDEVNVA